MKKPLLFLVVSLLFILLFATVSNAQIIFKDADGNELLRHDLESSVVKNEFGIGFAKWDEDGDALTWYITETETIDNDTVHTVSKIKTSDAVTISSNTLSINKAVVDKISIVSINLDVGGYTKLSTLFNSQNGGVHNIMYAYIPSYVTVFSQRMFRGAERLVYIEIPYDSELTDLGVLSFWETKSLREIFIPKNVGYFGNGDTVTGYSNASGHDFFHNCHALKKVIFHPDNIIVEMKNAPLRNAPALEEVRFGNNLKFLGDRAFRGCYSLKTVYFGQSFEGFYSNYMFWNCSKLEALYLPATFGSNTTDMTHKWTNAFDSTCSSNFKIYFTGTEEQLLSICEEIIAAGSNPKFSTFVVNGSLNMERVVFVTECEAFFNGQHGYVDDGLCTTELSCQRCNAIIEYAYEQHDNQLIVEYANGFSEKGYKRDGCTRCTAFTEKDLSPVFVCYGYSVSQYSNAGISILFKINYAVIEEIENDGFDFEYGVFAIAYSKIGNNEAINHKGEVFNGGLSSKITNTRAMEIKITGFETEEQKNVNIVMGAYVIFSTGTESSVSYIQPSKPTDGEKYSYISFNQLTKE